MKDLNKYVLVRTFDSSKAINYLLYFEPTPNYMDILLDNMNDDFLKKQRKKWANEFSLPITDIMPSDPNKDFEKQYVDFIHAQNADALSFYGLNYYIKKCAKNKLLTYFTPILVTVPIFIHTYAPEYNNLLYILIPLAVLGMYCTSRYFTYYSVKHSVLDEITKIEAENKVSLDDLTFEERKKILGIK